MVVVAVGWFSMVCLSGVLVADGANVVSCLFAALQMPGRRGGSSRQARERRLASLC